MLKEYRKTYMLLAIAKLIEEGRTPISTRELSKEIGMSHQSAARYLKELEKEKLIETIVSPKGRIVKLSNKGLDQIKLHAASLLSMVNKVYITHVFTGKVFTGLGEGAYYISRKPYLEQFQSKLGFQPYPGTLNLRIEQYMDQLLLADKMSRPPIFIKGFANQERVFGDGYCYPVIVNGIYEGAIVKALRTVYDNSVVEIISPHNLRRELNLKDGDKVTFVFKTVTIGEK
jgi:riboflavin kinase